MNEERTGKCLRLAEHIRSHLIQMKASPFIRNEMKNRTKKDNKKKTHRQNT